MIFYEVVDKSPGDSEGSRYFFNKRDAFALAIDMMAEGTPGVILRMQFNAKKTPRELMLELIKDNHRNNPSIMTEHEEFDFQEDIEFMMVEARTKLTQMQRSAGTYETHYAKKKKGKVVKKKSSKKKSGKKKQAKKKAGKTSKVKTARPTKKKATKKKASKKSKAQVSKGKRTGKKKTTKKRGKAGLKPPPPMPE